MLELRTCMLLLVFVFDRSHKARVSGQEESMSRRGWQREVEVRWCYMVKRLGVGIAVGIRIEHVRVGLHIAAGPIAVQAVVAGAHQNQVVLEVEEEADLVVACMGLRVGSRKPA
jgi:hypothetical protein